MTKEAPFGGVVDAASVAKFIDLADIVKDDAGQKQIRVEFPIMRAHARCQSDEAHNVFQ